MVSVPILRRVAPLPKIAFPIRNCIYKSIIFNWLQLTAQVEVLVFYSETRARWPSAGSMVTNR